MNITDFLLARITQDEAAAQASNPDEHWSTMTEETGDGENIYSTVEARATTRSSPFIRILEMTHTNRAASDRAAHVARWDPARVLAECAAKRAIIKNETSVRNYLPGALDGLEVSYSLGETRITEPDGAIVAEGLNAEAWLNAVSTPITGTKTLRILARVYADHPDYNPDWNNE